MSWKIVLDNQLLLNCLNNFIEITNKSSMESYHYPPATSPALNFSREFYLRLMSSSIALDLYEETQTLWFIAVDSWHYWIKINWGYSSYSFLAKKQGEYQLRVQEGTNHKHPELQLQLSTFPIKQAASDNSCLGRCYSVKTTVALTLYLDFPKRSFMFL